MKRHYRIREDDGILKISVNTGVESDSVLQEIETIFGYTSKCRKIVGRRIITSVTIRENEALIIVNGSASNKDMERISCLANIVFEKYRWIIRKIK